MKVQYTYDGNCNPVGVFVPINDWNSITERHADIEELSDEEKALLDQRLYYVKNHPDRLMPIEVFLSELEGKDEF